MNPLVELLQKQITRQGVVSFENFMEMALYCPKLGYYERPGASIGRGGDFMTSVSVGTLFGELLAFQFANWLEPMSGDVHLVEAGAHDGRLARDVLTWLKLRRPELFRRLTLWLLEPSESRQGLQRENLAGLDGRVRWYRGWEDVPQAVRGVIYSNELMDAFPVRRFGWNKDRSAWFEWGVAWADERFVWQAIELPESDQAARMFLAANGVELSEPLTALLPQGYTFEASPQALAWWSAAAENLGEGYLLALDYGAEALELFQPHRAGGTLRAYHQHRVCGDLLAMPGEQDLTAHVNFTALRSAGEAAGLKTVACQSQASFLSGIAARCLEQDTAFGKWTAGQRREFQTLIHPEHLGSLFKVLIQQRPAP